MDPLQIDSPYPILDSLKSPSDLNDMDSDGLRLLAAEALARIGGVRARVALEAFADDGDRAVRAACRDGLRSLRS